MRLIPLTIFISIFCCLLSCAQSSIPNKAEQIGAAVMAAPPGDREAAAVMGYDSNGELVLLREGTNNFICIADNPNEEGFGVACYHRDLEPFMARGRALRAEGKNQAEVTEIRESEAKAGSLQMPEQPTTLHILFGENGKYDPASGKVSGAQYRYVVYIPWATAESTGLPTKPLVPGGPWIMDPGTHKAHIMISPPKPE